MSKGSNRRPVFVSDEEFSKNWDKIFWDSSQKKRNLPQRKEKKAEICRSMTSDALGFGQSQLDDFEKDRVANGFSGVEFVKDKRVPEFYQVKCDTRKTRDKYLKHRGMVDKNKDKGILLSQANLERASKLVSKSAK